MQLFHFIHRALILLAIFALLAGCSSRFEPLAPERAGQESEDPGILSGRSSLDFDDMLQASQAASYTELSAFIDGNQGGSFSHYVSGYSNPFSLIVPAGTCQTFGPFKILVPNDGVPVYQLLPHMVFNQEVTVTLDYSMWIENEVIEEDDPCELLYMNEATSEFEQLSPRVLFDANPSDPTITFETIHFSRWIIDKDRS